MLSPRRLFNSLVCLLALALSAAATGASNEYRVGPPPPWVVPIEAASAARSASGASGGREFLLSDVQRRIENNNIVTFVHMAVRTVASAGVESSARFSVTFDPVYQTATLHAIAVRRNGTLIDKIHSAGIRVMQRETELEARIVDGRKTINVEIDDVRVGDIVEYAYSLSGTNPVFANIYAGSSYLQWEVPVERAFVRLLVPAHRTLRFDLGKAGAAPVLTQAGGYRDYRWDRKQVAGLRLEEDAPDDYDPYAQVQWTEFADWRAVARWSLPLYKRSTPSPELAREIDRIAAASPAPEERLLAALRLVQRDIRYLGIETGASSHAPAPASVVFRRRFGDCKDKAVLLLTILDGLGIRAEPALVNSGRLRPENATLPSPHAFNHVLVRATVAGQHYWIDPTRSEQHGDLAHLHQPDYGLALVIAADSTSLTPMNPPARARRHVLSTFDASAGMDQPVKLVVATTVQGNAAETTRSQLISRGAEAIQKDYLNYYARKYPSISLAAPMKVSDDKKTNTITLTEHYTISKYWSDADQDGRREVNIWSPEVSALLGAPNALNRTAPLPLKYPHELQEVTVIKLFSPWNLTPKRTRIEDDAFEVNHALALSADQRTVTVTDTYLARADRVAPDRIRAYAAKLTAANDETGLTLYSIAPPPTTPGIALVLLRLAVAAIAIALIAFLLRVRWKAAGQHKQIDSLLLTSWCAMAMLLLILVYSFSTATAVVTALCVGLTVLAVLATILGSGTSSGHWLHMDRQGRRVHSARDMLIGASTTMLILPRALQA
ncbi:DUF3857 domain-containing transglutaminase family protein [Massilia sp. PAMC28688]|uniref:DUF3857 domain-containing transglutaminase family protein n=1 Tax=Massilia sp. PAMC28688 TaxID=2861283 RepID=UPI001C62885E|nr:DUF3857 domain-containing transglutaminase family protein [Massilia sp. PAMC28688]QYF93907.1 DUF3857 domain-containing transglutaminase family protein [Massilia sp. PAMC28688]